MQRLPRSSFSLVNRSFVRWQSGMSLNWPLIRLNDDTSIPALGFGVCQSAPGEETKRSVLKALEVGYRHIDTAQAYRNEKDVGDALKQSGLKRGEVYLTSKVFTEIQNADKDKVFDATISAVRKSVEALGTDYVDLYLIHAPIVGKRLEAWRALEKLKKDGVVKSIGVSNYGVRHLEELLKVAKVPPAVNQIEISPFGQHPDIVEFCMKNDIALEAYSPLTRGKRLKDKKLVEIAAKYDKDPAQVLIRWSLQHNYIPLPKSVHKDRIKSNFDVFDFEISEEDMKALNALNEDLHTIDNWDPTKWE